MRRGLGAPEQLALLDDPATRQRYVTGMFDLIAPRYDRFTRWFSFGMDAGWKRRLVADAVAGLSPATRALDLACGTGDLAELVAAALPGARVLGLDASAAMVAAARRRHAAERRLAFIHGDMLSLPLPDRSCDLVTVGYGLRNVPDHHGALGEIARVLRPGGRLAVLDFTRPAWQPWRACYLGYLRLAGDCYGWCWHRDPAVYGYISRSVARFVSGGALSEAIRSSGLRPRSRRRHLLGGMLELQAERP